jgi:magnesium chelatase accessory protein
MPPLTLPPDWPHRAWSRRIACAPHLWHVQEAGNGPSLLLLHGAGGATHSWRHLMPLLVEAGFHVIAPDLPGQGFTRLGARSRCGLDPMAEDLVSLCTDQGWEIDAIIGHSAGAALALRMAERLRSAPKAIVGINAALGDFDGVAGWIYPAAAKLLAATPFVAGIFSRLSGTRDRVNSLLSSTGSEIEAEGKAQYLRLVQTSAHVDATLAMMAQWQLSGLLARLPEIRTPCLLIASAMDRAVPPEISAKAARRMPNAIYAEMPRYGHLVQEEDAGAIMALIAPFLAQHLTTAQT